MLEAPKSINPPLPDEYYSAYRDAVGNYMSMRNGCLNALLELVADESTGNTDNASRWRTLCSDALSGIEGCFRDQLELVSKIDGPNDLPALGGVAVRAVDEEKQFFTRLADVNAAAMRDRLVCNAEELKQYTEQLGDIWERIMSDVEDSNKEQRASYDEIVALAKKAVNQLAEADRTQKEKAEKTGSKILWYASKLAGPVATALNIPIPDLAQSTFDILTEWGSAYLDLWTEIHPQLLTRLANYRSALSREEGGVLPVFRQCREQVHSYWNERGTRVSSVWPDLARASLDDWKSRCATSAQRDDADRFSADVYSKIKDRWRCVKDVADDFEKKWTGVFYGALAPTTQDQLTDAPHWKESCDALVSMEISEIGRAFLNNCDEIYGASLSDPIAQLKSAADNLPDEPKAQVKEAIQKIEEKIQSEIKDRIAALHQGIGKTLDWFTPDSIRQTFDRSELEKLIV